MVETNELKPNTLFIEVSGSGLPEVDGLFVPSTAPPAKSESGTVSSSGYWNGKMAWDRADGASARSPSLSYSNSYQSWRISRLDGHLAYEITGEDNLPPTDREWNVYKMGVAPAPKVVLHHCDPRQPCPKPNVVFVLGGPGTGKGTMCELAETQLGWTHLSTGELLRAERQTGGPNADIIEECLAAGKLAPNEIVVTLLKNAVENATRTTGKNNFLLDGFPRSLANLEGWYEIFGRETELPKMLYLECPYAVLEQRILGRANFTGRSDDNVESIKLRFDTFKAETLPTVELFRNKNLCVEIDTSQDRQTVYDQVRSSLDEFTDKSFAAKPLTEKSEMLLGLRPFPQEGVDKNWLSYPSASHRNRVGASCVDIDEYLGLIVCAQDPISEGSHTTQHSYFAGRQ
jgi:UMP-CMP kinase